ncbi:MAG: phosphotransferase enzyme family protein [Planctomycetota bacterium]|jgi:hypothetical protein
MRQRDETELRAHLERFDLGGRVEGLTSQPGGHINASYQVTCRKGMGSERFLLQGVNSHVFEQPFLVMHNVERVTDHLSQALRGHPDARRRSLQLVPLMEGGTCFEDDEGDVWRVFPFIEGSVNVLEPQNDTQVTEAARAFGTFGALMDGYSGASLVDTIPEFHHTPKRLDQLREAAEQDAAGRARQVGDDLSFVAERRLRASRIQNALERGHIPVRVAHNDAKIANVLFDEASGEGLCVIDLDTVMPGSCLHDFGDLVRSMLSGRPEDERELDTIDARPAVFEALVDGYLTGFGDRLVPAERELLVEAGWTITLECGSRFLADHLAGDRYFPAHRDGHNLDRARSMFRLCAQIEARQEELLGFCKV